MEGGEENWSVAVENLVDEGNIDGAISLLESVISKLETLNSSHSDLQLATALSDLAKLYSSQGFSLKADQLHARAFLIRQRAQQSCRQRELETAKKKDLEESRVLPLDASPCNYSECKASASLVDDDWEAVADCEPNEIFCPQHEEGMSKLSLEDHELQIPKRRGRGTFLYRKDGLYSDQQSDIPIRDEPDNEVASHSSKENEVTSNSRYGTSHVLVLADFPPSTKTMDLEKLFENFRDRGFVIRWVNDTVALAVFRTPPIALEARNSIHFPFIVRGLDETDDLLSLISKRDLEPPCPRPKTSARTAQRLIAHGMGHKLPTTTFGSSELRKQEEARKNRIMARQLLRDEAWGPD